METTIRDIFLQNIKTYNTAVGEFNEESSSEKRNKLTTHYYIVYQMHKRYGCPNCKSKSCNCDAVPEPHRSINTTGW